jgi:hypothetical protein
MSKVLLPLGEMPDVIRESARTVLAAHGYQLCDARGNFINLGETEAVLRELGNNASQALCSIDENPENQ